MCASKFIDGEWYRARIENVVAGKANVFYVDYGNREVVPVSKCASLPGTFQVPLPYAHEYKLACVTLPKDADYAQEAVNYFREVTNNKHLLINLECKTGNIDHVTLYFLDEEDIAKKLIGEGLLIHEKRTETRLRQLISNYEKAQNVAKKNHHNLWQYGDFTDDDVTEFGYSTY